MAVLGGAGASLSRRGYKLHELYELSPPPAWAACSPLCSHVMPSGLIGLHRDTCPRFSAYVEGAVQGRWASW